MSEEPSNRLERALIVLADAQTRLEGHVADIAQAQTRTIERVGRIEAVLEQLVQAQTRMAAHVEQLVQAQTNTIERVGRIEAVLEQLVQAQARTEERVGRLETAVADLAQAQRRTEEWVADLAQAQRRTEERLAELADGMDRLRKQVGGLSELVGGDIEDVGAEVVYATLRRMFGWEVSYLRRSWEVWGEEPEEVDIFGSATDPTRPETPIWIVGEAKRNLTINDVKRFIGRVARARNHLEGEVFPVVFCYRARPDVQTAVREANLRLIFSYGELI